ncbi:hypothetical protein BGX34_009422 [Mortierella sp. NVP85]|nr:hypothetical protein BGX34_009422 [Mortierella sp. NVP85]
MNPLELPEIAELVATYLEGKDLATCVRISKTWRDMFLRYRWRVIRVGIMDGRFRPYKPVYIGPHRTDINNHRHWIQELSLVNMFVELDVRQYPNLRCLKIDMYNTEAPSHRAPMDLVTMAPLLVDLKLTRMHLAPSFWETLSTHPHIRSLTLSRTPIEEDDTPGFWKTCMKLESLKFDIDFECGNGFPRNVVFDRMRSLDMAGYNLIHHSPYQLHLILQSPMLESLNWEIDSLKEIEECFTNSRWPQLKKLHIKGFDIKDKELAFILNRVGNSQGRIEDFDLVNCNLGTQVFEALSVHFSTLVKADTRFASLRKRSLPSDLLCLCPRLEVLKTQDVYAKDIAERGPWVCQRLRELMIYLCFQESEQDLHQLIYERLSSLIRLERLTIQHPYPRTIDANEGLAFRLDYGLEHLASLQQLTYFCIGTTHKGQLGMEEAVWMVENLRKLRRMTGFLNTDEEVKVQLVSVFESHGIVVNNR